MACQWVARICLGTRKCCGAVYLYFKSRIAALSKVLDSEKVSGVVLIFGLLRNVKESAGQLIAGVGGGGGKEALYGQAFRPPLAFQFIDRRIVNAAVLFQLKTGRG